MDIVEVIWIDSATDESWVPKDTDFNTSGCTSVGYLMKDEPAQICLVQNLAEHCMAGRIAIPKACIVSIKRLKEAA